MSPETTLRQLIEQLIVPALLERFLREHPRVVPSSSPPNHVEVECPPTP